MKFFRISIILLGFLNFVKCSCKFPQHRIIGGDSVAIKRFPYQAAIEENGEFICGAVIIHPKFILTAAHCVLGIKLRQLTVRAGTSWRNRFGKVAQIASFIDPLEYPAIAYDIALIELIAAFERSEYIQPIQLASKEDTLEVGNEGIITGFGRTTTEPYPSSQLKILKCLETKVIPRSYCERSSKFNNATFCAGSLKPKIGACDGDSGSPFVFQSKLYGLVSAGFRCTHEPLYEIYISISYFVPFISDQICKFRNFTLDGIC